LPASYLGARFANDINAVVPLRTVIAVTIIVSVVLLFYRYAIVRAKPRELSVDRYKVWLSPAIGLVMGLIMGATSISGSIIVIVFIMGLKLPSPNAVGTTSVTAAASLLIASFAHLSEGNIDWLVVASLTPGVLLGAAVGATYADKVPRGVLRTAILVLLFAAGVVLLFDRGDHAPAPTAAEDGTAQTS